MRIRLDKQESIDFAKRLIKRVSRDDLSGAAAELSYRFFLALFPFFIFLGALGGLIASLLGLANPTDRIMDALGKSLPPDAASVLRGQIDAVVHTRNVGLMSVGILGTVWAASSGVGTIVKALNRIYDIAETRSIWKRWAMALGLTLVGGGTLLAAFSVLIIGERHLLDLADAIGVGDATAKGLALARWPVVIVLSMTAVSALYWWAPNAKRRFRWITPGSLVFAIAWAAASAVFGIYVGHFGSYNATYGALGGVVVALVWFYITSFILLLGAELNVMLSSDRSVETAPTEAVPALEAVEPEQTERRLTPVTVVIGAIVGVLALRRFRRPAKDDHVAIKSSS